MKIDAHQHFWQYSSQEYGWIGETEKAIKRDFLPEHLSPILAENNLQGCVAVQARQTDEETQWLLSLAKQNSLIKGVVGWIDLRADNLASQLSYYEGSSLLKGFRHVLQDEPDPAFMLQHEFIRGLALIADNDYSYDLLVFAHQLPQTIALVNKLPPMRLVVDHIAKPDIASGEGFQQWQKHITELAAVPYVFCKVSGMVTEADHQQWQQSHFTQYLDTIFNAFGPERIMFGSDWPVCLLASQYQEVKKIVSDYVQANYPDHVDQVFGLNACKFYKLL
ncbi:amidohydrolase family protein [Thalassotalea sp. PLHSN55]|uniref:amidohydrolase family protein n=1 Tax=Thalassotalea sp. PLHSN55 TaxID=3435888 RepID=UPI003F839295